MNDYCQCKYRRNSLRSFSVGVPSDSHCPNLNCQIVLPFSYASIWGFATCPACGIQLVLNDISFPNHWLVR